MPGRAHRRGQASQKTLDEVIADWLAEQQHEERVSPARARGDDLTYGSDFALEVIIQITPGDAPVVGANASARFLSTAMKPTSSPRGRATDWVSVKLTGTIPKLEKGQGLLVVSSPAPAWQRRGQVPGPPVTTGHRESTSQREDAEQSLSLVFRLPSAFYRLTLVAGLETPTPPLRPPSGP